MKITRFLEENAKSGQPGSFRECSLYRYPREKTSLLTFNSGAVSLPRTALIVLTRCSFVRLSISMLLAPMLSLHESDLHLPTLDRLDQVATRQVIREIGAICC